MEQVLWPHGGTLKLGVKHALYSFRERVVFVLCGCSAHIWPSHMVLRKLCFAHTHNIIRAWHKLSKGTQVYYSQLLKFVYITFANKITAWLSAWFSRWWCPALPLFLLICCLFLLSLRQPDNFCHPFKASCVCEDKFFICLIVWIQWSCLSIPHCSAWLKMRDEVRKRLKIKFWYCLLSQVVQYRNKCFCGMKWLALRIQHGCCSNFGKYCFCLG